MYKNGVLKKITEKRSQKTLTLSVVGVGVGRDTEETVLPPCLFFSQKTTKNANNFGKWPIDVQTNKTC